MTYNRIVFVKKTLVSFFKGTERLSALRANSQWRSILEWVYPSSYYEGRFHITDAPFEFIKGYCKNIMFPREKREEDWDSFF